MYLCTSPWHQTRGQGENMECAMKQQQDAIQAWVALHQMVTFQKLSKD